MPLGAAKETIIAASPFSAPLAVHLAEDLRVICGAREGDALGPASELVLDDVYSLRPGSSKHRLHLNGGQSPYPIARGSDLGVAGADVHADCLLTFISDSGIMTELAVLVEVDATSHIRAIYGCATAPLCPGTGYRLIAIERAQAEAMLHQQNAPCLARGTRITRADGRVCPVEHLRVGDAVLTSEGRTRSVLRIAHTTERAIGARAPVLIAAGTYGNTADLRLSRATMLSLRAGALEIAAGDLLGCTGVSLREGGFVDYFQPLFETSSMIYAEQVAVRAEQAVLPMGRQDDLLADELAALDAHAARHISHTESVRPVRAARA